MKLILTPNDKQLLIFVFVTVGAIAIFIGMLYFFIYTEHPSAKSIGEEKPSIKEQNLQPVKSPALIEKTISECDTCPNDTDWSKCSGGLLNLQTKIDYTCDSTSEFKCTSTMLTQTYETTIDLDALKKEIVRIKYDVSGCCDQSGNYSAQLGGSGSGVILFREEGTSNFYIATSRHVIDCVFTGSCSYPNEQKITVRTQDGDTFTPTSIMYAPNGLDLAILKVNAGQFGKITENKEILEFMMGIKNYNIGDEVVAIGYPATALGAPAPILEFATTQGTITNTTNLLTWEGTAFKGIQSDALVNHGSSGGGLFTKNGQLIGIVTWMNNEYQTAIAIETRIIYNLLNEKKNSFVFWQFCNQRIFSQPESFY